MVVYGKFCCLLIVLVLSLLKCQRKSKMVCYAKGGGEARKGEEG